VEFGRLKSQDVKLVYSEIFAFFCKKRPLKVKFSEQNFENVTVMGRFSEKKTQKLLEHFEPNTVL